MHLTRVLMLVLLALVLMPGLVTETVAQGNEIEVTLTRIESQAFPQVSVSVSVADRNGPKADLTATDFWIVEDGVQVPAEAITVESDTSEGMRLVLALDLSMKQDFLSQVKEATRVFVDSLEPEDRIAVIAFFDEVRLVQDFTNDKEDLVTAIDALAAEGNMTAFNEAAFEALNLASASPMGDKAVVMVTNSADNISARPLGEIIDVAQSASTPIYVLGFDRISPDTLKSVTSATGGQAFILASLDEIPGSFETIGRSLGQGGYKVTFQSGLKADGAEHALVIGVTCQEKEGKANGHFTAVPGEVTVNLPTLSDGQTVAGVVNLAVQVTAPTPLASVAYRLDGQLLAEVTAPPFSLKWDSTTLEPGTYRLDVSATDQAGNHGQAGANLTVVRPLVVTAFTSQSEVEVGDQVAVAVTVEALAEVTRVELLLDGELVASAKTPPYRLSLDSSAYPAGQHLITVRAEDSLGRRAEAQLAMRFLAPPAPEPKPQRPSLIERLGLSSERQALTIVGVIGATLVFLGLNILGLMAVVSAQKRRRRRLYHLEIYNGGNVSDCYELRAEEPMGALQFQFALNGVELPPRVVSQATDVIAGEIGAAASPTSPTLSSTPTNLVPQAQVMRSSSGVVGTLSSIGNILPGSAGNSLRRVTRPVFQAQSKVSSTAARTKSKVGQASRLTPQAGAIVPASPSVKGTSRPEQGRFRYQVFLQKPGICGAFQTASEDEIWFETPFVAPGERLNVDLVVAPLNPYRTQRYWFKVVSRASGQAGPHASGAGSPPLVEEDSPAIQEIAEIQGIAWFSRLLPYLVSASVALVLVLAMASGLSSIGSG